MLQKIIMYRLHIIKRGLLFHTHPDELRIGNNNFFDWDTSMNRRPFELMVIGLLLASSLGCNTNSCGSRMTIREWFQNRPRPLRDLFTRGDDCSECNAPAGQFEMGEYCPSGNCQSGSEGMPGYYPSDAAPAATDLGQGNRTSAGYPPAGNQMGSGVKSFNSNAELELPPMYGQNN